MWMCNYSRLPDIDVSKASCGCVITADSLTHRISRIKSLFVKSRGRFTLLGSGGVTFYTSGTPFRTKFASSLVINRADLKIELEVIYTVCWVLNRLTASFVQKRNTDRDYDTLKTNGYTYSFCCQWRVDIDTTAVLLLKGRLYTSLSGCTTFWA